MLLLTNFTILVRLLPHPNSTSWVDEERGVTGRKVSVRGRPPRPEIGALRRERIVLSSATRGARCPSGWGGGIPRSSVRARVGVSRVDSLVVGWTVLRQGPHGVPLRQRYLQEEGTRHLKLHLHVKGQKLLRADLPLVLPDESRGVPEGRSTSVGVVPGTGCLERREGSILTREEPCPGVHGDWCLGIYKTGTSLL